MHGDHASALAERTMARLRKALGHAVDDAHAEWNGAVGDARSQARSSYDDVSDRARGAYGDLTDRAQDAYHELRRRAGAAFEGWNSRASDEPMRIALVGVGVGLLVGATVAMWIKSVRDEREADAIKAAPPSARKTAGTTGATTDSGPRANHTSPTH